MKLYKNKNQLLIVCLVVGFFVGILFENIVARTSGVTVNYFESYFMEQYKSVKIISEEYLWYVIRARIFPLLLLCLLGCMNWKKTLVCLSLIWTGFLSGIMIVSAVIQTGIKGILLCGGAIFPQVIFYGVSYSILLVHLYQYPKGRWNTTKAIFMVIAMFAGIMLETYVNPYIIQFLL